MTCATSVRGLTCKARLDKAELQSPVTGGTGPVLGCNCPGVGAACSLREPACSCMTTNQHDAACTGTGTWLTESRQQSPHQTGQLHAPPRPGLLKQCTVLKAAGVLADARDEQGWWGAHICVCSAHRWCHTGTCASCPCRPWTVPQQ